MKLEITLGGKGFDIDIRELKESVEQDAKKRDFTINAIYSHLTSDYLQDPLGGMLDLKNYRIRACSQLSVVFKQKVRIFRALRLAETTKSKLDPSIEEYLKTHVVFTEDDAFSIIGELDKIMMNREIRWKVLKKIEELGLTSVFHHMVSGSLKKWFVPGKFDRCFKSIVEGLERSERFLFNLEEPDFIMEDTSIIKEYIFILILKSCPGASSSDIGIKPISVMFKNEEKNHKFYLKVNQILLQTSEHTNSFIVNPVELRDSLVALKLPIQFYPCISILSSSNNSENTIEVMKHPNQRYKSFISNVLPYFIIEPSI